MTIRLHILQHWVFYFLMIIILTLLCACQNYQKAEQYYIEARNHSDNKQDMKAMTAYLQALDKIGTGSLHNKEQSILRGRIYSNIAYTCGLYGDNNLSIRYFNKAGYDYATAQDSTRYIGNLLELARIYNRDSNSYNQSDSLILLAIRLTNDSLLMGRILDTYSIIFADRQDYYSALVYAQRALQCPTKQTETELIAYRHLQLARLYGQIGLLDSIVDHAQYVADKSGNTYYHTEAYRLLAHRAKSNAQLTEALENTYHQISATEQSSERNEKLQESVQYLRQWEENRTRKKWIIGIAILFAVLLGVSIYMGIAKRKKERLLVNQIEDLQAQLNTTSNKQERKVINHRIDILKRIEDFTKRYPNYGMTDDWKNNQLFISCINQYFPNLLLHLDTQGLNLTEQRLCVLILLGTYNNHEIADYCCIAYSSISKTKIRIANKLNTTTSQLRQYMIDITNQ